MNQLPGKKRRNPRLPLTVALIILGAVIILGAAFNVIRYGIGRFADNFFYPYLKITTPPQNLSNSSLLMLDKHTLASRVEELTELNRELAQRGHAAQELLEENRKLRYLLKVKDKTSPQYTTAEIILRDPLHFRDGFTINKGSRDGVVKGAAVIDVNEHGNLMLVGVVVEISARTSKVITVANSSLRISGTVSSNQAIGFTNSGKVKPGRGRIAFGMLPMRDDYVEGNMVTTTGFEHGIPAGIKIGELYIASSRYSIEQEDLSCELIPAVNFESLRFVSVALLSPVQAPEELK